MWAAGVRSLNFLGRLELKVLFYVISQGTRVGHPLPASGQEATLGQCIRMGAHPDFPLRSFFFAIKVQRSFQCHVRAEQDSLYPVRLWDLQ